MQYGPWNFKPTVIPTIVTVVVLVVLVSLGFWQLDRSDQKRALTTSFEARRHAAPLQIEHSQQVPAALYRAPANYMFRRAQFAGTWLSEQFLLDNRTHQGVAGYQVVSALRLPGETIVLVNRGWLALGESRSMLPDISFESKSTSVTGYLTRLGEDAFVLGDTGYGGERWPQVVQRLELNNIAKALGGTLLPLMLLLDPESGQGFVRDWKPIYSLPAERHLGYAFQWFALALALFVIYLTVNTTRVV